LGDRVVQVDKATIEFYVKGVWVTEWFKLTTLQ
jgi:hypothetical protein